MVCRGIFLEISGRAGAARGGLSRGAPDLENFCNQA